MTIIGIVLILTAIVCYFTNIFLIRHYINKEFPGLIDVDMSLPKPERDEEYLWERTAGTGAVPKWVSVIGRMVYPILIIGILTVIIALVNNHGEKPEILVIPGKSIASIKLDMDFEQVVSVLGEPAEVSSIDDFMKMGGEFRVAGEGKIEGELESMQILHYTKPPLVVILNESNKVESLQLGYTDNVSVQGYSFLRFKYLSKKELDNLGKPTSAIRDKNAEMTLMARASSNLRIEFYLYNYEEIGLLLGLMFDKDREQKSDYFIGLNYIYICQ